MKNNKDLAELARAIEIDTALLASREETTTPTPVAPSITNDELLAEFVELSNRKREIEAEGKRINARLAELQEPLLDWFAERGIQNIRTKKGTVYVAHEFFCNKKGGVATQQVCDALEQIGMGRLVSPAYSAASLKSWVREQIESGADLPEQLDGLLNHETVPRLKTKTK